MLFMVLLLSGVGADGQTIRPAGEVSQGTTAGRASTGAKRRLAATLGVVEAVGQAVPGKRRERERSGPPGIQTGSGCRGPRRLVPGQVRAFQWGVVPGAEPEGTDRRGAGEAGGDDDDDETFALEGLGPGGLGGDGEDGCDAEGPGTAQRVEAGLGVVALPGDRQGAIAFGGGGEPEAGCDRAGETGDVGARQGGDDVGEADALGVEWDDRAPRDVREA